MSPLNSAKSIFFFLCGLCAVDPIGSTAQTVTTLHSFDGTHGAFPVAGLALGTDGNFYGTTPNGGANANPDCTEFNVVGCGTFFKITPGGTLTTLYSFCSKTNCTDGAAPEARLVLATDGNFYGTTNFGGAYTSCEIGIVGRIGCGTVFKVTPSGALITLHSFDATDGSGPEGLVQATDGNFYGTTINGGVYGYGTVFKITSGGTLTTLHSFDLTDGAGPNGLVQATDGNFYGTTVNGGAGNQFCVSHQVGCGTVFKITPTGTLTTLHSFCPQSGCTDFANPSALVQASDGNFYGTTYNGGADNDGTVFKITRGGELTTLHSFDGTDGSNPYAGALVQATNENFYGTTYHGGIGQPCVGTPCGTIFEITSGDTLTTLHSFELPAGVLPIGGLVLATNGNFYGTTNMGGAHGYGTVFSLSVGLGPFVETLPISGKVGTAVSILGNNLTSTTKVTFNGTTATFTVVSSTEIKATVPCSATTGKVQVTTPSRTLTSNVNFQVNKANSFTVVTSSLNPSTFGQSVTFTAATASSTGCTPTGSVTFKDGSANLGTGTLSSGKAKFSTSKLFAGSHSITAVYGASIDFNGSTSSVLTQTVHKANSSTAVVSSLNPSTFGVAVTFTATVSSTAGTPTGAVTFKDGSIILGTGTLSSGKATFKTSALTKGTHSITAVYGGNVDFNGSTSAALNQVVN